MKNTLVFILILLVVFTQNFAQQNPFAFKIFHPEYARSNSEFEISLVASEQLHQYDEVTLLVFSGENLNLVKSTIRNADNRVIQNVLRKNDNTGPEDYRITVPEKFIKLSEKVFQINLTFKAADIDEAEISFSLETVKRYAAPENNNDVFNEIWEFELPDVPMNFYRIQKAGGKSAILENKSKIELNFSEEYYSDNLLFSFWARTNQKDNPVFNIKNNITNETIFSLSNTQFGIVKVPEDLVGFDFNEFFVCENSYNYYSVLLSSPDQSAGLYINGNLIYSTSYTADNVLNQLTLEFLSDLSSYLEIDEFKVIDLGDDIREVFKNINYKSLSLDNSRILYAQSFDIENPQDILSQSEQVQLTVEEFKIADSEVPIFSRTPQMRITVFETFYELTWSNADDANVNQYEIEKSTDGKRYETQFSVISNNDPAHSYYYIDNRNELDEVVYYRIRQLNKDGSINYSMGTKLGSAQVEYFNVDQNYPNPFNPATSVSVEVFVESEFEITVYDLVGTKIEVIHQGPLTQGVHVFPFDGSNLTSGVYIFEVASPLSNRAIKMILAK